eukprot:2084930-Alexandrium_andersonii.AAC.1
MSGPLGVVRGPKPQGSSTVISWRASRAALVASRARVVAHSVHPGVTSQSAKQPEDDSVRRDASAGWQTGDV